jgi:hypothetical protein
VREAARLYDFSQAEASPAAGTGIRGTAVIFAVRIRESGALCSRVAGSSFCDDNRDLEIAQSAPNFGNLSVLEIAHAPKAISRMELIPVQP